MRTSTRVRSGSGHKGGGCDDGTSNERTARTFDGRNPGFDPADHRRQRCRPKTPEPAAARYPANEPAARQDPKSRRSGRSCGRHPKSLPSHARRPPSRWFRSPATPSLRRPQGSPPKAFRLAEVQAQVAREAASRRGRPSTERAPVTLAEVQQQLAREGNRTTAAMSPRLRPSRHASAGQDRGAGAATADSGQRRGQAGRRGEV